MKRPLNIDPELGTSPSKLFPRHKELLSVLVIISTYSLVYLLLLLTGFIEHYYCLSVLGAS